MFFGRKKYNYLSMIMLYIKLVPSMAVLKIGYNIISALIPTISIIITARFIDNAVVVATDNTRLLKVFLLLLGIIVIRLFHYYADVFIGLVGTRAAGKLKAIVAPAVAERIACIKYKYYEDQDSVDLINRAMGKFEQNIQIFFDELFSVFTVVMHILGFIIVLGMQLWWATVVFILTAIPAFVVAYYFGKKRYDVNKEMSKIDRRAWYLSGLLQGRDTVEERYLFGYTKEIDKKYYWYYEKTRVAREKVTRSLWLNTKAAGMLVFISGVIVVALLLPKIVFVGNGSVLSVGMFISLVNALFGLSQQMQETIPDHISDIRYQIEYLKDLNRVLAFDIEQGMTCQPVENEMKLDSIEFRDVSFRYPGCEMYILKNFSITFHKGKHYAIVGVNGAGKTTLVKLLTRLYDNYEGEILINGKELREYELSQIKSMISVVYQDFCRYPLSFYQNIAIGNINHMENRESIEQTIDVIGLSGVVSRLADGVETFVSKIDKNGVDLSGGEWQRVALARLLVSSAPLKILDEPTAALDPISESRLYEQFHKIIKQNSKVNNMTLFISHRLGSTVLADEIIVIDNGKVAEAGSFDELMSKNGLYAEMFHAQAQWYREKEDEMDEE